jgi:hypothetical protein
MRVLGLENVGTRLTSRRRRKQMAWGRSEPGRSGSIGPIHGGIHRAAGTEREQPGWHMGRGATAPPSAPPRPLNGMHGGPVDMSDPGGRAGWSAHRQGPSPNDLSQRPPAPQLLLGRSASGPLRAPRSPDAEGDQHGTRGNDAIGRGPRQPRAFDVLAAPRREPWWVRLRRAAAMVMAVVVVATGVVSIVGRVVAWISPAQSAAGTPVVSDADFEAVAVPFAVDYLSWSDRDTRQTALARSAAPGIAVDGWGGDGRQWADSPTAVGVARRGDSHSRSDATADHGEAAGDDRVVTVRVRVTPYTAADDTSSPSSQQSSSSQPPTPPQPPDSLSDSPPSVPSTLSTSSPAVPNVASGSVPSGPGWVAGIPRWLNLAVPVAMRHGRVVVTATPGLVGSPQTEAHEPAVPRDSTSEDSQFVRDTRDTVMTLLGAYASGDLQYARAVGTSFRGLDKAATLMDVTAWRVDDNHDADGAGRDGAPVRVGDVTVTWSVSGDAGTLRCTYRVELRNDDTTGGAGDGVAGGNSGRWYLASIGVATEAVR